MLYRLARPLLFALSPHAAHRVAMAGLRVMSALTLRPAPPAPSVPSVPTPPLSRPAIEGFPCFGLRFTNRVGLAAGFDKSARYIDNLAQLGFGFIEVGT